MSVNRENGVFTPNVEDLLYSDLTVGGDVLDRPFLYELTRDWSPEALAALRERVAGRCRDFYRGLVSEGSGKASGEKDYMHYVDARLDSWFSPWSRFSGRMEAELDALVGKRGEPNVTPEDFCAFLDGYRSGMDPSFLAENGDALRHFAMSQCARHGWDYTLLSDPYKTTHLVQHFIEGYPHYVEAVYDRLVRDFRRVCSPVPSVDGERAAGYLFDPFNLPYVGEGREASQVVGFRTVRFRDGSVSDYVVFPEAGPDGLESMPLGDLPKEDRVKVLRKLDSVLKERRRLGMDGKAAGHGNGLSM